MILMRPSSLALATTIAAFAVAVPWGTAQAGYRGYDKPIPSIGGGDDNAQNIDVIENLGQKVATDLEFVDGDGVRVSISDVVGKGKPVLVTMGYYRCPMLCNLVHEGLAKAIDKAGLKVGQDFAALSVSVDPKEDPKSAKTNQSRLLRNLHKGADTAVVQAAALHWPFVMDPPDAGGSPSKALAANLGFRYFYDEESKQFAHAAVAFVLTPEGKISRYLYGLDFDPRDLRFALVEAGGGRVGTTLDKVLLTCFKYDPMTRKYTPYVAGFVRIGAGLCGTALAVLLAILWRKEMQMRRQRRLA